MSTTRMAPVSMTTVGELMAAMESEMASASSIAKIVETDVGLTTRVLGLANSAQFGLSRQVDDITQAVGLVGMNMTRTLAIAGATALLDARSGFPEARDHALATAACARIIAGGLGHSRGDAFSAGLIHDIGELLLWQEHPSDYAGFWRSVDPTEQLAAETDLYGSPHTDFGAKHLIEWRVPTALAEAARDHHDPTADSPVLTLIVAAADEAVSEHHDGPGLRLLGIDGDELDEILDRTIEEVQHFASVLC